MAQDWHGTNVGLPWTRAEAVGMSSERLARLGPWMKDLVDGKHEMPNASCLVARRGRVVFYQGCGKRTDGHVVEADSLYRIYSMTKPITSLLLLMLWEEGKVLLEEPVYLYLGNKWKKQNMRVMDTAGVESPCEKSIRVRDLLLHTAGLSYGFEGWEKGHPADALYQQSFKAAQKSNESLAEMVDRIASLSLVNQPGKEWNYSYATDVVGRLVEVISGLSLGEFMRQRLLRPLGMSDTRFTLSNDEAMARLVDIHIEHPVTGKKHNVTRFQERNGDYQEKSHMESGGGGLISSMRDYARFCQFCLNKGELDGKRLIGRKTFEFATSNHLPGGASAQDMATPNSAETISPGIGFGLGFAVAKGLEHTGQVVSTGTFYWGGAASTVMFCDPKEDLFAIFYTQVLALNNIKLPLRTLFTNIVYSALIDVDGMNVKEFSDARL